MLSYRHAFHAGNFADVFKHIVLCILLKALARKEKPYCYIDTHGGAGLYNLSSAVAQKNQEHKAGIARLWQLKETPTAVADYLAAVQACNSTSALREYPGSPWIARHFLRTHDRAVLTELHSSDFPKLQQTFANDSRFRIYHEDGYAFLKAQLPPQERRGLVLIDPAYERHNELQQLIQGLLQAYRRWQSGCFAIWYPVIARTSMTSLYEQLEAAKVRKILRAELCLYPDDNPQGLNGSGMLIINPPWRVDSELAEILPWLWQTLASNRQGRYRVDWLVPE